jgi:hypothetical protein
MPCRVVVVVVVLVINSNSRIGAERQLISTYDQSGRNKRRESKTARVVDAVDVAVVAEVKILWGYSGPSFPNACMLDRGPMISWV